MNRPALPADPTSPVPQRRQRRPTVVLVLTASIAAGAGYALSIRDDAGDLMSQVSPTGPQAMTARAGAVMGFDLTATTHTFTKDDAGGVETVVVKNPADRVNLELVRAHLRKEATRFAAGDYADPAAIHGPDMAGLNELGAAAERITVRYEEIPDGAQITFRSTDPPVVDAVHAWFDQQNTDHAVPGMGMDH